MTWQQIKAFADALMSCSGHQNCVFSTHAQTVILSEFVASKLVTAHKPGRDRHCTVCYEVFPCHDAKNALTSLMLARDAMVQHAQKFKVGDRVRIIKVIDDILDKSMLGREGIVEEVEENGSQINYYVDDMYLEEEMLELVA